MVFSANNMQADADGDFVHVIFPALYTGHMLWRPALIGQLSEASENFGSTF